MVGYYHVQKAAELTSEQPNEVDAIVQHYRDAAENYLKAAEMYPPDDECHSCTCLPEVDQRRL